jgi:hypothetical protein
VDALVNGVDTPGDEGDYFARLVLGQPVSEQEASRLQAENDGAIVTIDGVETVIEQNINAAPILTITADDRFYQQIGADIDGEAAEDQSGRSVSLSADGSVVAIGADLNDGNGTDSGHVRVYQVIHQVAVVENQTAVTTVTAIDPDGELLAYTLGGDDAELFSINSNGEITFKTAPDFKTPTDTDTDNIYNITVNASDVSLSSSQKNVAITVTDVDDNVNTAPTITSGTTASFAENGTGTVYATTATLFDISDTGVVTFKTAPNLIAMIN